MMDITVLRKKILELVKKTIEIVENEKEHNNLEFSNYEYEKYRVTEFQYTNSGTQFKLTKEYFYIPFLLNLPELLQMIFNTEEYRQLADYIKKNLPQEESGSEEISFFIQRIIRKYSETFTISQSQINTVTQGFISDLTKTVPESMAIVQLVGLILHPEEIVLGSGIKIRKPRKEDFEIERPVSLTLHEPPYLKTTAILEISKQTNRPMDIQAEIEKAITLLQLFRVGSIKYTTGRMHSSSRSTLLNCTMGSGDSNYPVYTYIINDGESENLQYFCNALSERLPLNIFQLWGQDKDYQSIAFDRYEDALIQTGIDERKITNIMMGFEALYFKKNERQELDYRLQMRIAKVLGKFSFDPILVKNAVKDAYNIRSIFSHGSLLSTEKKESYQNKYEGGVGGLTKLVLDFLRISLIVSISIEMEKAKWIDLIDNALIQESENEELDNVLGLTKEIIEKTKM